MESPFGKIEDNIKHKLKAQATDPPLPARGKKSDCEKLSSRNTPEFHMRTCDYCGKIIPNNVGGSTDMLGQRLFCNADCNSAFHRARRAESISQMPSEGLLHLLPVKARLPVVLVLAVVSSVMLAGWLGSAGGLVLGALFWGLIIIAGLVAGVFSR